MATTSSPSDPLKELVPFSEPQWYRSGMKSPYYSASHRALALKVRAFVERELLPNIHQWDEKGSYPPDLRERAYKAGIYGMMWPTEFGGTPFCEPMDQFHRLVFADEMGRCVSGGLLLGAFFTISISLPPVLHHGSTYLKQLVARDVISGRKGIALAVTEPYGGSDVAAIRCKAVRDGDVYVVNGEKRFITAGLSADWFTTAVRTGGEGASGLSVLIIDAHAPGVTVQRMKTQGWWMSATTRVIFEDVRVPVSHLVGAEGAGFLIIAENFNDERLAGCIMQNRSSRVCVEEAIGYARQRKTFGKRLIDHQVIRHKIMEMIARVELNHSQLENICYQIQNGVQWPRIAALIALLKVSCTKTMEYCAREASQVLGGASYIRGGVGEKVERIYREVRVNAIGGGSEEIMLDLASRMAKL